jgi:UDP-N-acetylglucosamine--dolichyl-phosphate N-acetylglucosaminephosphotransferase
MGVSIFVFKRTAHILEIFALLTTLLVIGFIGFIDDFIGGWKKGLKQWQKPLLTIPAALPLMAIKAGYSTISLPFFGSLDLGLIYPLLLIPIGIVGASQGFNYACRYEYRGLRH